jgi:hypothetical protein
VVRRHDLDAVAFSIADNRTHEFAEWNDAELAKLLGAAARRRTRSTASATPTDDLDALVQQLRDQEQIRQGPRRRRRRRTARVAIAKPATSGCSATTACSAATRPTCSDVHRVMAGEKAALVATDPPYLVDYTGERPNDSGKDWTATYREIDIQDADGFFRAVFTNVLDVLGPKGAIYCWHAHKRCGDIQRIWRDLGILDHQQIIWVKPTPVFGRVYWHFRHEPCVMGWRKATSRSTTACTTTTRCGSATGTARRRFQGDHPTSKPVELFVRPMKKHTKPGDVVFEPFSGSGSQLIAAERTGRRCRAIEISRRSSTWRSAGGRRRPARRRRTYSTATGGARSPGGTVVCAARQPERQDPHRRFAVARCAGGGCRPVPADRRAAGG